MQQLNLVLLANVRVVAFLRAHREDDNRLLHSRHTML